MAVLSVLKWITSFWFALKNAGLRDCFVSTKIIIKECFFFIIYNLIYINIINSGSSLSFAPTTTWNITFFCHWTYIKKKNNFCITVSIRNHDLFSKLNSYVFLVIGYIKFKTEPIKYLNKPNICFFSFMATNIYVFKRKNNYNIFYKRKYTIWINK